ncbi:MAG: ribosome maturation factor RimP [Lachnospiraceae bacterium]|nr:ribosome maturation factor RimP [Lachnospiraceae bacterium]
MTKHESYERKTEELILPFLSEHEYTLVDTEYVKEAGNFYLRLYIDKEGGFTLDDCELVSRHLSALLDENDFIDGSYILEVSSPGLGRPLKKEKDYVRNLGKLIEVRLFREENGIKMLTGTLDAYNDTEITVTEDGKTYVITKKNIALIREYVDWDA